MFVLTRGDAIGVCAGLGFKNVAKWNKDRMVKKLEALTTDEAYEDLEIDEDIVEDEEERDRLNNVLEQLREAEGKFEVVNRDSVEVNDSEDEDGSKEGVNGEVDEDASRAEEEVEDKEETVGDEKKEKKARKKSTKAPKEKTPRDKFGNKIGTQAAAINACICDEPKTARQLADETGFSAGRITGHMKWFVEHGFGKMVDKGVVLIGEE